MPRKRDESRAAEAVRLYHLGLDTRAVAAQLGADPRTVARWVGDEVRRRGPRGRLDVRDQRILDLRAQGLSYEAIGRRVHMSKAGVRKRVAAIEAGRFAARLRVTACQVCAHAYGLTAVALTDGTCAYGHTQAQSDWYAS